jgi:hypothetical protein
MLCSLFIIYYDAPLACALNYYSRYDIRLFSQLRYGYFPLGIQKKILFTREEQRGF